MATSHDDARRSSSRVSAACEMALVLAVGSITVGSTIAILGNRTLVTIGAVWVANVLMIALIHWGLRRRRQHWSDLGLTTTHHGWRSWCRAFLHSILVFLFAIASFIFGAILMANIVGIPEPADMSKYDFLRGNLVVTMLALVSVYLVSSFAEEVIYRGFMITRIAEALNGRRGANGVAVLVSSIVFGCVHSDWGIAGMVQATLMGVALGLSYLLVSRRLWVTILAHAYMDSILVLQMYFASS